VSKLGTNSERRDQEKIEDQYVSVLSAMSGRDSHRECVAEAAAAEGSWEEAFAVTSKENVTSKEIKASKENEIIIIIISSSSSSSSSSCSTIVLLFRLPIAIIIATIVLLVLL